MCRRDVARRGSRLKPNTRAYEWIVRPRNRTALVYPRKLILKAAEVRGAPRRNQIVDVALSAWTLSERKVRADAAASRLRSGAAKLQRSSCFIYDTLDLCHLAVRQVAQAARCVFCGNSASTDQPTVEKPRILADGVDEDSEVVEPLMFATVLKAPPVGDLALDLVPPLHTFDIHDGRGRVHRMIAGASAPPARGSPPFRPETPAIRSRTVTLCVRSVDVPIQVRRTMSVGSTTSRSMRWTRTSPT
jgi:hypothetical protein